MSLSEVYEGPLTLCYQQIVTLTPNSGNLVTRALNYGKHYNTVTEFWDLLTQTLNYGKHYNTVIEFWEPSDMGIELWEILQHCHRIVGTC